MPKCTGRMQRIFSVTNGFMIAHNLRVLYFFPDKNKQEIDITV
jgi:hypothetical protein